MTFWVGTKQLQPLKILMLDKNWLIDRRIALFTRSLLELGHEVRVCYVQPPPGRWERTEIDCPAVAFPYTDTGLEAVGHGIFPRPPHVRETLNAGSRDPRRKTARYEKLEEDIKKQFGWGAVGKSMFYLNAPDLALERLGDAEINPAIKAVLGSFFGLLMLPSNLFAPPADKADLELRAIRSSAGYALDHWDKQVLRYGLSMWQPDLICANDYLCLRSALALKKMLGVPVMYDAHELYSYQPNVPHGLAKRMYREERVVVRDADGMIMVNDEHRAVVMRDFQFPGPTALCPNASSQPKGFDITRRYDLIRQKAAIPKGHKIMLFQGGVNKYRRIDFLLRAIAMCRRRDIHMVFLTFGAEVPDFEELAKDLGIADRVHFLPLVPWEDVVYWAASADVGVMPYQATDQNTAISSPNKMYEFIIAGTPMIGSSDLVNVRKIVGGEGFGVVKPLRTESDYVMAIEEMFDESLGGPERFRQALIDKHARYAWDVQSKDAMALYDRLIDQAVKLRQRHARHRKQLAEFYDPTKPHLSR